MLTTCFSGEVLIGVGHIGHGTLCSIYPHASSIPLTQRCWPHCHHGNVHTSNCLPSIPTGTHRQLKPGLSKTALPLKSVSIRLELWGGILDSTLCAQSWSTMWSLQMPEFVSKFISPFHPSYKSPGLDFSFSTSTTNLPRGYSYPESCPFNSVCDGLTLCIKFFSGCLCPPW